MIKSSTVAPNVEVQCYYVVLNLSFTIITFLLRVNSQEHIRRVVAVYVRIDSGQFSHKFIILSSSPKA